MSYTSLPTFTENSIGKLFAHSNDIIYSGPDTIFTASGVPPGVYLFTCNIIYVSAQRYFLMGFVLTNTSTDTDICTCYDLRDCGSSGAAQSGCLTHVFTISSTSTLTLKNNTTSYYGSLSRVSYALVRIA